MWRLLYSESVFIFHVTNSKPARVQRCIQARNFSWPWILTCSSKTETSMPATSCLSTYILYFHIMTLSNHTSVGGTLTFVMRSHADFQYMLLCCFVDVYLQSVQSEDPRAFFVIIHSLLMEIPSFDWALRKILIFSKKATSTCGVCTNRIQGIQSLN